MKERLEEKLRKEQAAAKREFELAEKSINPQRFWPKFI